MERSETSVAGQTKEAAVLRKGGNRKKRTTKELSIFSIAARYTLAHTKAGARSGDAGNTDFPLGFLLGGLCGGMCRYLRFSRLLRYAY